MNSFIQEGIEEAEDVRRFEKRFEKTISALTATNQGIQAKLLLQEANKDFKSVRNRAKQAKNNV